MIEDPKDQIKQRLDIADVIGEYLALKPAGSGGLKALCPFHGEKTPSFHVSREKQIWHCFGCNKGGDVFAFIMDMEGIDFRAALELLAQKAGVELTERVLSPQAHKVKEENEHLRDLHTLAQKYYELILHERDAGGLARTYLHERGIDQPLARRFGLGYAPDDWRALCTFLRKRGYNDSLILKSGLAKKTLSGGDVIDRFRGRLMIPLHDGQGKVVGFTGRVLLEGEKTGPKYLNSPQTALYNKSEVLYGLHLAKPAIRAQKSAIIVEGNLDVIASHKAGVEHVVGSSGTALTHEQLFQLKKLTDTLLLCFDTDDAGFQAAVRGIGLAQAMGFNVYAISIAPELGKDPDDVVRKDPNAWKACVAQSVHIMDFYAQHMFKDFDPNDVVRKKQVVDFFLAQISQYGNVVEREHWLMRLADRVRMDASVLRKQLVQNTKRTQEQQSPRTDPVPVKSREQKAFEQLFGMVLAGAGDWQTFFSQTSASFFPQDALLALYNRAKLAYSHSETSSDAQKTVFSILHAELTQEQEQAGLSLLHSLLLQAEQALEGQNENQVRDEWKQHIHILQEAPRKDVLLELESKIRRAESVGDQTLARQLTDEYLTILKS